MSSMFWVKNIENIDVSIHRCFDTSNVKPKWRFIHKRLRLFRFRPRGPKLHRIV